MRHCWLPVLAGVLTSMSACAYGDPGTQVHPEPGSRTDSLMFHAFVSADSQHANRNVRFLEVFACGDSSRHLLWRVERPDRGFLSRRIEVPLYIRYGRLPAPGWLEPTGPTPLAPGCYLVRTFGGGIGAQSKFEVAVDGRVALRR
jgi:hypothetical protein